MARKRESTPTTTNADPYKDVNADANTLKEGTELLQQLITKRIAKLSSEPDKPIEQYLIPDVTRIIKTYVQLFPRFDEDEKVVEAWGLIWAYRNDGKLLWSLMVIWDSDKPDNEGYRPHYGYEFRFNRKHFGGPGHIWLNGETPKHHRDAQPMHEVLKGEHCGQEFIENGKIQIRLDYAMRLWGLGLDSNLLNDSSYSHNVHEYNKIVRRPPIRWNHYKLPSFGSVDGSERESPQSIRQYEWEEAWKSLPWPVVSRAEQMEDNRLGDAHFMGVFPDKESLKDNESLWGT